MSRVLQIDTELIKLIDRTAQLKKKLSNGTLTKEDKVLAQIMKSNMQNLLQQKKELVKLLGW